MGQTQSGRLLVGLLFVGSCLGGLLLPERSLLLLSHSDPVPLLLLLPLLLALGQQSSVILDADGGEHKHQDPAQHSAEDEQRPKFIQQPLLLLGQPWRAAAVQLLKLLPALCCLGLVSFCTQQHSQVNHQL